MIVKVAVRSPACIDARVNAGTIERKLSEQQEIPIPTAFLIVFLTDQASARNLPVMFPDQSNYEA
jgi:hypothetical protein